jgi:hypothetical protein
MVSSPSSRCIAIDYRATRSRPGSCWPSSCDMAPSDCTTRNSFSSLIPPGGTRATFPPEPTRTAPHAPPRRSRLRNAPEGLGLDGRGNVHAIIVLRAFEKNKQRRSLGSGSDSDGDAGTRGDCGPETGSTGHPQERQHSAATWRDAGSSAPGEGHDGTVAAHRP